MAFPTSDMPGYKQLRDKITNCLNFCQERASVEFKESQPFDTMKWHLLKTIMAMANLRDGGMIVIGLNQRGAIWQLTGIDSDHLQTYNYDAIIDQLQKHASPQITVDIVVHLNDNQQYLVFNVHQFRESPIICRKNTPNEVAEKERMFPGDIYIRPHAGKPQTTRVVDSSTLNELLEIAAEDRARRMIEQGGRIGLSLGDRGTNRYAEDTDTLEMNDVRKPYWYVDIRPRMYQPNVFQSNTECINQLRKARVEITGWECPIFATDNEPTNEAGSAFVGTKLQLNAFYEHWRMFRSGHFINVSALHPHLSRESRMQMSFWPNIDWSTVFPISLDHIAYAITLNFEFATRLCQAQVYHGELEIDIRLVGARKCRLLVGIRRNFETSQDVINSHCETSSLNLLANSESYSIRAMESLCESFNVIPPPTDELTNIRQKLLSTASDR